CCAKGKIYLSPFQELLSLLSTLLARIDQSIHLFRQHIRMYNSVLAFTFINIKIDDTITETNGVYNFHIHVYDTKYKLQNRMFIMHNLNLIFLAKLQQILYNVNPYSSMFRQVDSIHRLDLFLDLKMVITDNRRKDSRHYNISTISEIAVIMISDEQTDELLNHNIVLCLYEEEL
ncbi:10303_t:CDS:2, partial [Cetraspora pellucida]